MPDSRGTPAATQIVHLEHKLKKAEDRAEDLIEELQQARDAAHSYRVALAFYADPLHHEVGNVKLDSGLLARAALEGTPYHE